MLLWNIWDWHAGKVIFSVIICLQTSSKISVQLDPLPSHIIKYFVHVFYSKNSCRIWSWTCWNLMQIFLWVLIVITCETFNTSWECAYLKTTVIWDWSHSCQGNVMKTLLYYCDHESNITHFSKWLNASMMHSIILMNELYSQLYINIYFCYLDWNHKYVIIIGFIRKKCIMVVRFCNYMY